MTRSALALKTLLFEPGGAIAAAATTSLPEAVGGDKNWDYRFAWVRDSSFTLDAFIELGLDEEVHAAVSWLLAAVRRSAPDLHVFYTLEGGVPGNERDLDVPGYRHSRPVRAGNGAARQSQLGHVRRPVRHLVAVRSRRAPPRPRHRPLHGRPRRSLL